MRAAAIHTLTEEKDVQMEDDEEEGDEMDDIEDGFNQYGEGHEVIDGGFEDPDYNWQ